MNRKMWTVCKAGQKWDGPHYTEKAADQACLRARADGHGLVYVECVDDAEPKRRKGSQELRGMLALRAQKGIG